MNLKDEDLPALRELESAVIAVWIRRPDMSDYAAGRAYEAAHQTYRSRLRNHEPKPPNFTGIDAETFGVVRDVCEKLLATGAEPMKGLVLLAQAQIKIGDERGSAASLDEAVTLGKRRNRDLTAEGKYADLDL